MVSMIDRILENRLKEALKNNKSFFLLGPRQAGKTTLVTKIFNEFSHIEYNLMNPSERLKFEKNPSIIKDEILAAEEKYIFLDEVQKIPELLDIVQILIDKEKKVFGITGSSARKLKRKGVNLLPGRILSYRMDPLVINEYKKLIKASSTETLKKILKYGELPEIFTFVNEGKENVAEELLYSYVITYIEEEVRAESLLRKIGAFAKFLKIAAEESGKIVSLRSLSQDIGVLHQTISEYYRILEDCLIVERIESLIPAGGRGKVQKAPKFIFFDTGVANASAEVLGSPDFITEYWGKLFEQWVGLTILRHMRANRIRGKLFYWRDYSGREVDWIIEYQGRWVPVEVKWGENIKASHLMHLNYFINTFSQKAKKGIIVFSGNKSRKLDEKVSAHPFNEFLNKIFNL